MIKKLLPTAVFLGCTVALGCSSGNNAPARVSGSVSYKGEVLKAGVVRFHTTEGSIYLAPISSDGVYNASDLPVGDMVVTLEVESINPNVKETSKGSQQEAERRRKAGAGGETQKPPQGVAAAPAATNYVKVPAKYTDPAKSPLIATLVRGYQKKDFELTD